jgi:glutamine synthetase
MFANSDELLKFIKDEGVEMVDVRFCDLPGVMQHFTVPVSSFDQAVFDDGLNFDGSSIRGSQAIHESDMSLFPDPTTAYVDPFRSAKTLVVNFFIHDPLTGEAYSRDPRNIARKAMAYLSSTGIGDTAYFAPEAEFYIFDSVRFETKVNEGFYHIDSEAGAWNSGSQENNRGYKVRYKGGYFPVAPYDHFGDLRDTMVTNLEASGLQVERAHHEVGTAGQAEINYKFDELLKAADDVMKFKYIIKNTAWEAGKTVTFMPKPIFGDNGSGMHCHQSIWNDGEPLFYDETGYGGLSDTARYYIGGILKHAPSLLAFTNPTVNSYHRLVPGFEAPISLVYSQRNRSACVRIPITGANPKAKRIESRCPDPSANPYLAFSALLLAGLDGIKNKIEPPAPIDKDIYELPPDEMAEIDQVPTSLNQVLDSLEGDHDFLTEGNVFTPDLIETWIDYKRSNEIMPVQQRPHPHEFELYYDI